MFVVFPVGRGRTAHKEVGVRQHLTVQGRANSPGQHQQDENAGHNLAFETPNLQPIEKIQQRSPERQLPVPVRPAHHHQL